MVDATTQGPIVVHSEATGLPYIVVPLDQLAAVEAVLRGNNISYWVDTDAISINGTPEIVFVTLGRGEPAARVQTLLDAV